MPRPQPSQELAREGRPSNYLGRIKLVGWWMGDSEQWIPGLDWWPLSKKRKMGLCWEEESHGLGKGQALKVRNRRREVTGPEHHTKLFNAFNMLLQIQRGFPGGSAGKEGPAMWETWVWSLGWEDPLKKGTATHSSILVWRTPWTV